MPPGSFGRTLIYTEGFILRTLKGTKTSLKNTKGYFIFINRENQIHNRNVILPENRDQRTIPKRLVASDQRLETD